jgi:hypothetical protein
MRPTRMRSAAAGTLAFLALFLNLPAANAMTFQQGCAATHGRYWHSPERYVEYCEWHSAPGDPGGSSTVWQQSNDLPRPTLAPGGPPPTAIR